MGELLLVAFLREQAHRLDRRDFHGVVPHVEADRLEVVDSFRRQGVPGILHVFLGLVWP